MIEERNCTDTILVFQRPTDLSIVMRRQVWQGAVAKAYVVSESRLRTSVILNTELEADNVVMGLYYPLHKNP